MNDQPNSLILQSIDLDVNLSFKKALFVNIMPILYDSFIDSHLLLHFGKQGKKILIWLIHFWEGYKRRNMDRLAGRFLDFDILDIFNSS